MTAPSPSPCSTTTRDGLDPTNRHVLQLRLESPAQMIPRFPTRDVQLHGVSIANGSTVLISWGSANRDEKAFENPDGRVQERVVSFATTRSHGA